MKLSRAAAPGTDSHSQLRMVQVPLPSPGGGRPQRGRGHGLGAGNQGGRFPTPGSSSCCCHGYICFLFDSSQTAERGGCRLPAWATAAWGCLQQPHVGFPERDSKPDILRLQNTQVSRAKNSCCRAPGTGKGACWPQRRAGRPITSCFLLGAQLLSLPSLSPLTVGGQKAFVWAGHPPVSRTSAHGQLTPLPAPGSLLWDANEKVWRHLGASSKMIQLGTKGQGK